MNRIYLDYNATTPILPEVAAAMQPYLGDLFGNPSSSHWFGVQTRKAVEAARAQVAAMLNCQADEVVFTSGGSESDNFAVAGYAFANKHKGNHIITAKIEHPAVLETCRFLETQGFIVTYLPVDGYGLVDVDDVRKAIRPGTILISVMQANNEVGTLQPVEAIAELAREHGVAFHTDSAQAVGKVAVEAPALDADLIAIAGHKFYAPKGVGALFIRRGITLQKLIYGAAHEQNLRAGTENVLEIVGLGKAAEIASREWSENYGRMKHLRDRLEKILTEQLTACRVNGHPQLRLPNTLSISFPGIEANTIISELDTIACSPGAACHSDKVVMSHVLEAMGVPVEYAMGTIRFSVGVMTTESEIDEAGAVIVETINRLLPSGDTQVSVTVDAGEIRLTRYTHGLGCACKLRPQALEEVLASLPRPEDANVLVGAETADDAAVYLLREDLAIVQTVDFFTPIVDDPYHFGAIAAANSLSDIYAMGAKPLFALNIVGFPSNRLPMWVLQRILEGAADKAKEAGISIIGGHTVDDNEPKYGLAVSGVVDPRRILTNNRARVGDRLILTKPIGLGIVTTAIKRQMTDDAVSARAIAIMSALNRSASEALEQFDISACTDVTGFGLLGHLLEMTRGSAVTATVFADTVPIIPEAPALAQSGAVPGGTENNLEYVASSVIWDDRISRIMRFVLCDAQTSGGLLVAVKAEDAETLATSLLANGVQDTAIIGEITGKGNGTITVK